MNRRIEWFFWRLKAAVQCAIESGVELVGHNGLTTALVEFRFFYDQVRPHQHLRGMTPAEVSHGLRAETLRHPETEY